MSVFPPLFSLFSGYSLSGHVFYAGPGRRIEEDAFNIIAIFFPVFFFFFFFSSFHASLPFRQIV